MEHSLSRLWQDEHWAVYWTEVGVHTMNAPAPAPQLRYGICRNCSAAGLGWAGLGWAGHEDQHFITITSLPPRPSPAARPRHGGRYPAVNLPRLMSFQFYSNTTITWPFLVDIFIGTSVSSQTTGKQSSRDATACDHTGPCPSKVQSVGGRAGAAAAPWPDLVTTIHPHQHSTACTYICTSPLLLCHKLRR